MAENQAFGPQALDLDDRSGSRSPPPNGKAACEGNSDWLHFVK
ncbi:MAG: hypothetical protein WBA99_06580 [Nodosilinea sp.]